MKVSDDDEEAFDLEQYRRECEAEMQQYLDVIGRDTPEGKALLREWEEAKAGIPRPTEAEPEPTLLIDLRLLKDSPLHRRHEPSEEELTALARSIEANGLKNPIDVRPDGDKYEIICGHRRAAAYRRLLDAAQTDSERAKYRAIRARVHPGTSDVEAIRRGIAEDLIREEFSAADAARSLHVLQELDPQLDSAQKLSDATGVAFKRVARSLQLGNAPEVVQEAARDGMIVNVEADADGDGAEGPRQERRKLQLLPALELSRLHAALSKTGAGKRHEQTRKAIERSLAEGWSSREVKRYVDKAIAALDAPAPKKKVGGRPRVVFKWEKQRLQVDASRLDALDASQKAELRKVLEDILRRL